LHKNARTAKTLQHLPLAQDADGNDADEEDHHADNAETEGRI